MAHIEPPRKNKDGTWSTRVRHRAAGAGSKLLGTPVNGHATRKACIAEATFVASEIERAAYLATLTPVERTQEIGAGELVEQFMRHHVIPDLRKTTNDSYEDLIPRYFTAYFADKLVSEIAPADGLEWRLWVLALAASRSSTEDDELAGKPTANKVIMVVKGMFNWAVENGLVASNPFANLSGFKHKQEKGKREFAPTPEMMEAIRSVISIERLGTRHSWVCQRDRTAVSLLYGLGLRFEECFGARWSQAIDGAGSLRTHFRVSDGKTDAAERSLEIWDSAGDDLLALYDALGHPLLHSLILPGIRGAKQSRHNWRDVWLAALTDARKLPGFEDMPHITPHNARRTCASMLGYALTPPHLVIRYIGHEDARTTMRYYQRAFDETYLRAGVPMAEQMRRARATIEALGRAVAA